MRAYIPGDISGHDWQFVPNTSGIECDNCGYVAAHAHVINGGSVTPCTRPAPAPAPPAIGARYTSPIVLTPRASYPFATSDSFFGEEPPAPPPDRSKCVSCKCELSKTLDVYYGRDLFKALQCVGCRR